MKTFSVLLLTLVLATGHFAARGSGGFQNAGGKTGRSRRGASAPGVGENRRGRGRTQRYI
jgi:hypothetical protein